MHAGFSGFRAFVARKKGRCKLIGNRFVIPHDTIPSNVTCNAKTTHQRQIINNEDKNNMKDILDKISSYNLFNYLLPGILFVYISKYFTDFDFVQTDTLIGAFFYYFVGMIVSRFGSLFIEPILKKIGFLKFADYKNYVSASKLDSKIELFSEINNTYRTLISTMFLLGVLKFYNYLKVACSINNDISIFIAITLVFLMFLFSYRKQTNYITKRISANNQ